MQNLLSQTKSQALTITSDLHRESHALTETINDDERKRNEENQETVKSNEITKFDMEKILRDNDDLKKQLSRMRQESKLLQQEKSEIAKMKNAIERDRQDAIHEREKARCLYADIKKRQESKGNWKPNLFMRTAQKVFGTAMRPSFSHHSANNPSSVPPAKSIGLEQELER